MVGLSFAFCLFSTTVMAQTDDQLWTSGGVRYRPKKKIRIDLTQHIRMDQDISRVGSVITEGGISKTHKSGLRVGGAYRFQMSSKKKVQLEPKHRVDLYGRFKKEVGPMAFSYRFQFQEGYEGGEENPWKHEIRNKLGIDYKTKTSISPSIAGELFAKIDEESRLTKWRGTLSLQYKLNKANVFEGYFRVQNPLDDGLDPTERIVGVDYQYRIPRKKRKKKQ